jgi:hypothetical protein
MLAAMLIVVAVRAALGLLGFLALLVGMRNEPPHYELSSRPPSLLAAFARRALGVSVRKPSRADPNPDADAPREPWFAGAGYTPRNYNDEGR